MHLTNEHLTLIVLRTESLRKHSSSEPKGSWLEGGRSLEEMSSGRLGTTCLELTVKTGEHPYSLKVLFDFLVAVV